MLHVQARKRSDWARQGLTWGLHPSIPDTVISHPGLSFGGRWEMFHVRKVLREIRVFNRLGRSCPFLQLWKDWCYGDRSVQYVDFIISWGTGVWTLGTQNTHFFIPGRTGVWTVRYNRPSYVHFFISGRLHRDYSAKCARFIIHGTTIAGTVR